MENMKFGMLTAVRQTEEQENGSVVFEWKCDCGNTVFKTVDAVKYMNNKNCGCRVTRRFDITGQRFGKLVAVQSTNERRHGTNVVWEWKCDCGGSAFLTLNEVKQRKNPNCGCLTVARCDKG